MTLDPSSPQALAGRVGARVSLVDLRLKRLSAELLNPAAEAPFEVSISLSPAFDEEENVVVYAMAYDLRAKSADDEDVFQAEIEFSLVYALPDDVKVTSEELGAFGSVNVPFSIHPYVRELVQSLTTRFGLPPLVLDVLRSPLDVDTTSDASAGDD